MLLRKYMGLAGILSAMIFGCGGGSVSELNGSSSVSPAGIDKQARRDAAQIAVSKLSAAIRHGDVRAFRDVLDSKNIQGIGTTESEIDTRLGEVLAHQRAGWLSLFGETTPPIAEIVEGYQGSFDVFLSNPVGERTEKPLHFYSDSNGRITFSGLTRATISPEEAAATAGLVTWGWRFHNYTSGFNAHAGTDPNACPGFLNHSIPVGFNALQNTACFTGGFASCSTVVSDENNSCLGTCWYQWVGDDVWLDGTGNGHGGFILCHS